METVGSSSQKGSSLEGLEEYASGVLQRVQDTGRSLLPVRAIEAVAAGTASEKWLKAQAEVYRICRSGGMVLLCGPRWTGKTVMAVSMCLQAMRRGSPANLVTGLDLLLNLRANFNSNTSESRDLIRRYFTDQILVIDEVGVRPRGEQGYSDNDAALMTNLINKRYENKLATIFISNEKADEAEKQLGSSITRRIQETGMSIEVNWPAFCGNQ